MLVTMPASLCEKLDKIFWEDKDELIQMTGLFGLRKKDIRHVKELHLCKKVHKQLDR